MYALLVNVLLEYVEGSVWRRVIWHIREIGTGPMENLSRVIDIMKLLLWSRMELVSSNGHYHTSPATSVLSSHG